MHANALALAFLATLAYASAQAATRIDDPEKFVREVYGHIEKTRDYREPDDIYTPRLASLFALDSKEAGGEVGRIDFDFWINAQDFQISKVRVTSEPVDNAPSRQIVVAKFINLGTPEEIHFYFERTDSGWKLDDASSAGKEDWTLSVILKYGWVDAK
jgi:hypothetical protein